MHKITLNPSAEVPFHNITDSCIGTGRLGLGLMREYQEELEYVQDQIGFEYIRGHGLFCDDLGILQTVRREDGTEEDRYCFTYLDRVMDAYVKLHLKPLLELGFMPRAIASGEQTVFYWKGNVTPPKDDKRWTALVCATLQHLVSRYGDTVYEWPIEVWNEPNLTSFWKDADLDAYLHLYEVTVRAIRGISDRFQVGGPAVCGGNGIQEWMHRFFAFCTDRKLPLCFVTRHLYMGQQPERHGRYLYHTMCPVEQSMAELHETRDIMQQYEITRNLPLYVTEFNSSYNPFCPIHDTNENAAIMAELLARIGDEADLASYWTFGDVFEEGGIPPRPFHGGFGLVAAGSIPKPTLYAFSFFAKLRGTCIWRDEHLVVCRNPDGSFQAAAFNHEEEPLDLELSLPWADAVVEYEGVDEEHCNPLKAWHDLGEPAVLDQEHVRLLKQCAQPQTRIFSVRETVCLSIPVNGIAGFRIAPVTRESDEGYDYAWYCEKRQGKEL